MTRRSVLAACAGLTVLAATSAFAQAAPAPNAANRVEGRITAVNGNSVTVAERGGTTATITVPDSAKVWVATPSSLSSLQNGGFIEAMGVVTTTPASVDAKQIHILDKAPKAGKDGGMGPRGARGTITSTSPLTISTPGGTSVAITTTDTTRVFSEAPGTASSITVGEVIRGRLDASNNAIEVHVSPAPVRGARHGRHGAGAPAATPAPAPAPNI